MLGYVDEPGTRSTVTILCCSGRGRKRNAFDSVDRAPYTLSAQPTGRPATEMPDTASLGEHWMNPGRSDQGAMLVEPRRTNG